MTKASGTPSDRGIHELLLAANLDLTYVRAVGDYLWTDKGHAVLDLAQGAGTGLLGHNHPEVVAEISAAFSSNVPHHAQFSVRRPVTRLIERLSCMLGGDRHAYSGVLTNSGTEANEAALKHALLEYRHRTDSVLAECTASLDRLARSHRYDQPIRIITDAAEPHLRSRFGACRSARDLCAELRRHNGEVQVGAPKFLALRGGFHGKTLGSLALTNNQRYREPFIRDDKSVKFVSAQSSDALSEAFAESCRCVYRVVPANDCLRLVPKPVCSIAGLFLELIQGEGGIRPLHTDFVFSARILCDRYDVPLIADEIQTFARTGRPFACQAYPVVPDYVTLAKGLGGGVCKIGVALVRRERYRRQFETLHTSTFAGDEISCRAALRTLDILTREDNRLIRRGAQMGEYLHKRLSAVQKLHPDVIHDIRGRGMMLGIEFWPLDNSPSSIIRSVARTTGATSIGITAYLLHEERIRVLPTLSDPNTVRVEPSLLLARTEADRFVSAVRRLAEVLSKANAHRFTRHYLGASRADNGPTIENFRPEQDARVIGHTGPIKAAFICHPVFAADVLRLDPSMRSLSPVDASRFARRFREVAEPDLFSRHRVRSSTGSEAELSLIMLPFTSEHFSEWIEHHDFELIRRRIDQAVAMARSLGATVCGLGQYTSIVSTNGRAVSERGIGLTTGNALTAGMAVEALIRAARDSGLVPGESTVAVIGAGGNIGSVSAQLLAPQCKAIRLVGGNRLGSRSRLIHSALRIIADARRIALEGNEDPVKAGVLGSLVETGMIDAADWESGSLAVRGERLELELRRRYGDQAPIRIDDGLSGVGNCELVFAAASPAQPILFPEHIRAGAVICDIGVPANVDLSVLASPRLRRLVRGGAVELPHGEEIFALGNHLPTGTIFACIAETVLLALEGHVGNYSYGSIEVDQVRRIMDVARKHGFSLAHANARVLG